MLTIHAGLCNGAGVGSSAWIGFSDSGAENTWVWSDGSANDYTNWNAGNYDYCSYMFDFLN